MDLSGEKDFTGVDITLIPQFLNYYYDISPVVTEQDIYNALNSGKVIITGLLFKEQTILESHGQYGTSNTSSMHGLLMVGYHNDSMKRPVVLNPWTGNMETLTKQVYRSQTWIINNLKH